MSFRSRFNRLLSRLKLFEYFLVGGSNDEIIRKMPCSIYLLKNEPTTRGRAKR